MSKTISRRLTIAALLMGGSVLLSRVLGFIRDAVIAYLLGAGSETDAYYVGMIGSRRKVAAEMAALDEAGVDPAALARVHAPIGIDIGAETPAEIGVAILAEIIAVRRTGTTPEASLVVTGRKSGGGGTCMG